MRRTAITAHCANVQALLGRMRHVAQSASMLGYAAMEALDWVQAAAI